MAKCRVKAKEVAVLVGLWWIGVATMGRDGAWLEDSDDEGEGADLTMVGKGTGD